MDDFPVSDPINIKEFLNECKSCLSDYDLGVSDAYVGDKCVDYPMDFNASRFDVKDLLPEGGYTKDFLEKIGDTKGLKALEERKKELEARGANNANKMKGCLSEGPWVHSLLNKGRPHSTLMSSEKIQRPDVLLKVHFYKASGKKKPHVRNQEFDVLGQTTLTSLRDKLCCPSDREVLGNYADDPDAPVNKMAEDEFKSNFFFFGGTFYNDMNRPECIDMSKVIREWAEERKDRVGPFKHQPMEGVRFIDLTVRLGQPYLYTHQGDCEHLIMFSDIRLVTDWECQRSSEYPILIYKSNDRRPTCLVCGSVAKWTVDDSKQTPDDRCMFCDLCLKMFFYDAHGNLLEPDIKVFRCPGRCRRFENDWGGGEDEDDEDADEEEKN